MVAGSCQESTGCGYVVRRLTTSLGYIVETVANAFAYSIPGTTYVFFLVTPAVNLQPDRRDKITSLPLYRHDPTVPQQVVGLPAIDTEKLYMVAFDEVDAAKEEWELGNQAANDTLLLHVEWRIQFM